MGRDEFVLDIGSGDKPFWRGDVFLDDLALPDNQRSSGAKTITGLGAFVDGRLPNTPFKDRAFDFSFCSHLLEHVERPDLAIQELQRISKRGYLEVPNGILEVQQPFASHLWFVFQNGKKLVFVRKSKKIHDILCGNGSALRRPITIPEPFIRMYWEGSIAYEIVNSLEDSAAFHAEAETEKGSSGDPAYLFFVNVMRAMFYREKKKPLREYMRPAERTVEWQA